MSARERFEAWFRAHEGGSYAPGTGNYNDNHSIALSAWQAARAEALEEARRACAALGAGLYAHAVGPYLRCEDAIKALKEAV